uniref:Uncharacterized protein n=1 Tax=Ditylenchus dipsaci TaxID=166011 RepID=A0A915ELN4_9BILA
MNVNFNDDLLMSDEEDLRNLLSDASDEEGSADEGQQQHPRRQEPENSSQASESIQSVDADDEDDRFIRLQQPSDLQ